MAPISPDFETIHVHYYAQAVQLRTLTIVAGLIALTAVNLLPTIQHPSSSANVGYVEATSASTDSRASGLGATARSNVPSEKLGARWEYLCCPTLLVILLAALLAFQVWINVWLHESPVVSMAAGIVGASAFGAPYVHRLLGDRIGYDGGHS
ncbi:hypothetical protein FA95DRAFT_1554129 [Auriscalpium vulgare]|uniref:Uncharacterized protein n=1 Tax=Auriscalpium vulgare TaxID=40419 RepID=A0ACB8S605_9AGAM|nr:hypothetical protein FA95DRAFT_1554129 [Auriscalpium vulgare]